MTKGHGHGRQDIFPLTYANYVKFDGNSFHCFFGCLMNLMTSLVTTSKMQQCFTVRTDIYHVFLLLFHCCILLEMKLGITTTTIAATTTTTTSFVFLES